MMRIPNVGLTMRLLLLGLAALTSVAAPAPAKTWAAVIERDEQARCQSLRVVARETTRRPVSRQRVPAYRAAGPGPQWPAAAARVRPPPP
jgi:hypothetical protein